MLKPLSNTWKKYYMMCGSNIMNKVPVKIVQTKDIHGNKKVGVMLDVSYYIDEKSNPEDKVKKFKNLYFETLQKANKIIPKKREHRKPSDFWKLSRLLTNLKKSTDNEFIITNFRQALQRDFIFTGRYIDKILEFVKYYKKNEVLDSISLSYYVELSQKKNKLDKLGIFENEKRRLIEMGKSRNLPGIEEYRKQLLKLVENKAINIKKRTVKLK